MRVPAERKYDVRPLRTRSAAGAGAYRPYLVLNAADMATGSVFSFTQDQFDMLCADLAKLKLADGVAASAAFPVALTALTLKNYSPCPAQEQAPERPVVSGWDRDPGTGKARPIRVIQDLKALPRNPGRYRRGRIALDYLNEDGGTQYVQLLDGGIADNLGLTLPLTLLTSLDQNPSILARINKGMIKRLAIIVVNARSEPSKDYGARATPPGLLDTLLTVIGTPIDSTSFLLMDRLEDITGGRLMLQTIVPVDFDFIADADCRRRFKNIATSWALPKRQIDALIAIGGALVHDSAAYEKLVVSLGGTVPPGPSVAQVCAAYAQVGASAEGE